MEKGVMVVVVVVCVMPFFPDQFSAKSMDFFLSMLRNKLGL
jgi:hypothetical protein